MDINYLESKYIEHCKQHNLMPTAEGYRLWLDEVTTFLAETKAKIINGTSTINPKGLFQESEECNNASNDNKAD